MKCNTCNGMRFVSERVPEYRSATFYRTDDGYPCWQCDGGTPVRERFATGRMLTHTDICSECQGTGIGLDPAHSPDCSQCHGTGERNAWDGNGEWETEPCQCSASARIEVAS